MSVTIISGIPIFAGPLDIVTSIQAPNIPGGGAIGIGDVFGLQAALDAKLSDTIGTIAPFTVDVTITGAELNFLAGVTSLIQGQLDGKVDLAGDTMTGNLLFAPTIQLEADAGTFGLPSIVCVGDLDTGYFWPAPDTLGIAVGGLDAFRVLPTGVLQSQIATYETLVVLDDDIPNKKYVDDAIGVAVGGPFLPLAGGTMTGAIAMGGFAITGMLNPALAQDAATKDYVDTEIIGLNLGTTFLALAGGTMSGALGMGSNLIQSVSDPSEGQDAATKNYVDTEITGLNLGTTFLALAGGNMTGDICLDDNRLKLDLDGDSFWESIVDDVADLWIGGVKVLTVDAGQMNNKGRKIASVLDPTLAQDAATKNYVDTEIIGLNLGTTFLALAGGTMSGAINMGTNLIQSVSDPSEGQDAATKNYVDTQDALSLLLTGGTMSGALDMGTNLINNVVDPVGIQDAATKNYVDTEIVALGLGGATGPFLELAGGTMTGDLVTGAGVQHSADAGLVSAPSYAFTGALDAGMFHDGANLRFALGGASAMTFTPSGGTNCVDVHGRKIAGLIDPVADDEAVTKGFLDAQGVVKLLGSALAVDLEVTGLTTVYTVPVGKMHIITQVIVRTVTYTPGATPTNPAASVGLSGSYDQIIADATTLDWGGTAGAGDQAVYLQPKDGADTPNAGSIVRFQVDTAGAGTFSALTANVYVLGIEL